MRFRTPAARRSARSVVAAVVLAVGASVLLHIAPFASAPAMAAVGPEPGVSGSSVYWSVVDTSGTRVAGASFTVDRAPGGSNNWAPYASVTDCTAPGCAGPDLDPDAGEFQTLAPDNNSYRIRQAAQPRGYTWERTSRTETAVKPSGAVDLGRFVVVRDPIPQPVCTANSFYSVQGNGTLQQVNGATGVTTTLGSWGAGLTEVNALGIGAGGAEVYALQRNGNDVARILRLNQAGGWQSIAAPAYLTGSNGPIVAGAVSLATGTYYFGGFSNTADRLQFRLHQYVPAAGISPVGVVDIGPRSDANASGDMAFDGAGNLTIVRATDSVISAVTVSASALAAATGGVLPQSASPARALTGLAGVNGVAFDTDGIAYLANGTTAMRFDPSDWTRIGSTVTAGLVESVDLASCAAPPTLTVRASAALVSATDRFRIELRSGTVEMASTTTDGAAPGSLAQQIGPLPVRAAQTYRILQTMAPGAAADYATEFACTGGAQVVRIDPAAADVTMSAAGGASVVCTVTNATLVTTVLVRKSLRDVDGTNAQPGAGWSVRAGVLSKGGTVVSNPDPSQLTAADGTARWSMRHQTLTTPAEITVSETQQAGYRFVSGTCTVTPRVGTPTTVALPSEAGATLREVQPGSAVDCSIVNRVLPTTLTLVAEAGFGGTLAEPWHLSGTGPQGKLAGPAGASGATAPVSPAQPYLLAQSGGPATHVQVGPWMCRNQAGASVPVSREGSVSVALGDQVTCTVVNSAAGLVLLQRIVGSTALAPGQFTLTATPAALPGLATSTVVGEETVTAVNTTIVRPDHEYTLRSQSDAPHVGGQLELYLGTPQPGGAVDHENAALWQRVDSASVTVAAGETAIYRFTATAPMPLVLPLTGGVGADAYLFGGSALLLLAALLLIGYRMHRPKALLMTDPDRITPQRSLASPQEGTASMASTKKSMTVRVAAGLGAVALATLTVLGGALPASAAPDNIQPGQLGSITVNKFAEPATGTGLASDGTVVDTTGLTALGGVEFTVERVTGIDLTTDAGWAAAAALTPATVVEADLELVDSIETSATGVAVFDELPIGVYLVTETDPGDHSIAVETAPFLVSIPMAADNGWLYDVEVYPKNSLASIEKSVDDSAARGLGDEVTWMIKVSVPEIASNDTLDEFRITDTLDPRLTLVDADLVLTVPGAGPGDPRQQVALTYGTHFTATDSSGYAVAFTPAGRDLLAGLNGAEITIEGVTTVSELGDGIIQNLASVTVNGTSFSSAPVQTSWGTLAILKHVTGDEARVLAGADFQVFATEADAIARTNPISVAGQSTFTSLDSGIAFVPGLKAGSYWIVEMKAPSGYQLVQTPIAVTVDAGDVTETSVDVSVANAQVPAYTLPVTGGSGQAAFMVGGFGLLAGAMGFALLRRRKAQQDA